MSQSVENALGTANFILDDQTYRLIHLPASAITAAAGIIAEIGEPFCALIADQFEVSLLIPDEAVDDFANRMPEYKQGATYRLITIDAILEPDLIGFMATISTALANAKVGVFPYAAYARDHILVPSHQADTALTVLKSLQDSMS